MQVSGISIEDETGTTRCVTVSTADARCGTGGWGIGVVAVEDRCVVSVTDVVTPHHQPGANTASLTIIEVREKRTACPRAL